MKNFITFSGQDPLTIKATGSGEYIKNEVAHLVDLFALAEQEKLDEIRQDMEHYE